MNLKSENRIRKVIEALYIYIVKRLDVRKNFDIKTKRKDMLQIVSFPIYVKFVSINHDL